MWLSYMVNIIQQRDSITPVLALIGITITEMQMHKQLHRMKSIITPQGTLTRPLYHVYSCSSN